MLNHVALVVAIEHPNKIVAQPLEIGVHIVWVFLLSSREPRPIYSDSCHGPAGQKIHLVGVSGAPPRVKTELQVLQGRASSEQQSTGAPALGAPADGPRAPKRPLEQTDERRGGVG